MAHGQIEARRRHQNSPNSRAIQISPRVSGTLLECVMCVNWATLAATMTNTAVGLNAKASGAHEIPHAAARTEAPAGVLVAPAVLATLSPMHMTPFSAAVHAPTQGYSRSCRRTRDCRRSGLAIRQRSGASGPAVFRCSQPGLPDRLRWHHFNKRITTDRCDCALVPRLDLLSQFAKTNPTFAGNLGPIARPASCRLCASNRNA